MSKAKKAISVNKLSKKDFAKDVYKKLEIALLSYKNGLKKGGFEKSLKKASKIFAKNISRLNQKASRKKKKTGGNIRAEKDSKEKK